jgi:hypothetical protein
MVTICLWINTTAIILLYTIITDVPVHAAGALDIIMSATPRPSLAIATRLHLGHASHPPPSQQLTNTLTNFAKLANDVRANIAVVAVDAEDRIEGYSLQAEIERICRLINNDRPNKHCKLEILPVQPWGKFIPALNAIVAHSARNNAQCLLLASAEVSIHGDAMEKLWNEMSLDDTLVVGK